MIKLEVEKYCENCPEFEASVEQNVIGMAAYDSLATQPIHESFCNTVISCEHRERCRVIMDYLSKEKKDEQHNKN